MSTNPNDSNGSTPAGETPLDLDHYLLLDPQTQRVRFTRAGRDALARRFARSGVDLRRLLTLEEVEEAIGTVTYCEYHRLTPAQQDDPAPNDAIDDLHFLTDAVRGRPILPIEERRRRRSEAIDKLFAAIGMTV